VRTMALSRPLGARPRHWPWRHLAALAVGLALVGALVTTHPGRTAVRTLFFLPEIFPGSPVRPLALITPAPHCEELTLTYANLTAPADLCYPPGPGPYGGLVLTLGAHPLPRDDPFLVRLTDGLARMNLAVLRTDSPDLSNGRIAPREIDGLVAAFQALQTRPEVDRGRVGFGGFSVGGALATVAAADPRIRDEVRLVNSFGAYYDAIAVLRAITERQLGSGPTAVAWEPHPWSVHVFAEQIIAALPEGDERDYLAALLARDDTATPPAGELSPLGTMVRDLLDGERVDGDALLAALPPETRAAFARLSPATSVRDLHAEMFVMHDVGDRLVPYTESRKLVATLPPGVLRRYGEFHMFEHVYPRDPSALVGLLPEVYQLYGHLYAVFFELAD